MLVNLKHNEAGCLGVLPGRIWMGRISTPPPPFYTKIFSYYYIVLFRMWMEQYFYFTLGVIYFIIPFVS